MYKILPCSLASSRCGCQDFHADEKVGAYENLPIPIFKLLKRDGRVDIVLMGLKCSDGSDLSLYL
jgi:hypothetical protein